MLILRGDSVAPEIVERCIRAGVMVTATPKATQSDETFVNYLEKMLPEDIKATPEEPALCMFSTSSAYLSRLVRWTLLAPYLRCCVCVEQKLRVCRD